MPPLPNKLYDMLVFVAQILLPAIGSLYFTLAGLWSLPNAEEVVGTVVVVDTFLGTLLGLNKLAYNASESKYGGVIDVTTTEDNVKTFALVVNSDLNLLDTKSEVLFKINPT